MVSLREKHAANSRRNSQNAEIAVGEVVLLQNDSTKRVLWKLAIVKELITGIDSKVTAAVIQVADSRNLLKRSIKHLYQIEVKANVNTLPEPRCPVRSKQAPNPIAVVNRPRRRAAMDGELLRRLRS